MYYVANCVSRVLRLILLDLRTNWTYERTFRREPIRMRKTICQLRSRHLAYINSHNLTMTTGSRWYFIDKQAEAKRD